MSAKLDPTPRRSEAVSQFRVFARVSPAQAEYLPKVKQEGFVKKVVALDVPLYFQGLSDVFDQVSILKTDRGNQYFLCKSLLSACFGARERCSTFWRVL